MWNGRVITCLLTMLYAICINNSLCSKRILVICARDAFLGPQKRLQFVNQKLVYREKIVLLSHVCVSPHSRTDNYTYNIDKSKY